MENRIKLSRYKCEKLEEILKVLLILSDEELQAVYHEKTMTQELFDSIVDKCTGLGVDTFFTDFITKHQKFLLGCDAASEKELDMDCLMDDIKRKEVWLDRQLKEFYELFIDVI